MGRVFPLVRHGVDLDPTRSLFQMDLERSTLDRKKTLIYLGLDCQSCKIDMELH